MFYAPIWIFPHKTFLSVSEGLRFWHVVYYVFSACKGNDPAWALMCLWRQYDCCTLPKPEGDPTQLAVIAQTEYIFITTQHDWGNRYNKWVQNEDIMSLWQNTDLVEPWVQGALCNFILTKNVLLINKMNSTFYKMLNYAHMKWRLQIQWGKKVFSQPPIVQVVPLKKMREACDFHHRYTSTMRDKIIIKNPENHIDF